MKVLLLLFGLFLIKFSADAKVLIVSNNANNPAQYQIIQVAIDAASNGDTIYIIGSETVYGNFELNKRLVILGPGHNPKKQNSLKAIIGLINLGAVSTEASGSALIGLTVGGYITSSNFALTNISIKRCNINQIINNSKGNTNWVVENNIIGNLINEASSSLAPDNFLIRNNIFLEFIKVSSSIITNNIFIAAGKSEQANAFKDVVNSNISNNIFYGISPHGDENSAFVANNSIFNNNISFSNHNTLLPYGTNSGTDNKVDVDPKFTKFPADGDRFKYEYDFHLQAGSPGKNAGTDGKDIGIYGGIGFSETGEPPIPQIREFIIRNAVVAPNGNISVRVKVEAKK